tara:strand:- start:88 stop:825 length:738 start_codon:yes stop_codon:yes gene_type:complete
MSRMEDSFIDLTLTSPPYDNLRTYNGYTFDFESIAKELFRVTKDGGIVVWIVNDATIKGSETGTSFKQALFFKECGFNLHDTMIWDKKTFTATGSLKVRYAPVFEYMFILSKGKCKTFNPIKDKKNKHFGKSFATSRVRQKDGKTKPLSNKNIVTNEYGQRHNIWNISTAKPIGNHPAVFPEQLSNDHIISWSNKGDLVYDCFMGSGTTAKMSISNKRNYIGSEMSTEYCEIIRQRLNTQQKELF